MSSLPTSSFGAVPLRKSYFVRSSTDPSRIYEYRSVLGPNATNHVGVGEDHPQFPSNGVSPLRFGSLPSIFRRMAIHAVAKVLVHLVNPRAFAPVLDKHLHQHGGGEERGPFSRDYVVIVDDERFKVLNDGHVITLRFPRAS